MSFLALIPARAWLIAGVAAAIGFMLWHDHHVSRLYQAQKARAAQLESTLAAERRNAAQLHADLTLNQVTSHALQERLSAVERERRDAPLPRLRCTARVPRATAEGGGAGGSDGAAAQREPEAVAFDPSADLDQYGADCAVIAERLSALQGWERARGH
jgi:ABC-type transporter Mla subunit MlaD